ncbi:MAG: mechanosensitive ion channel family protein [Thiobacillus sp.]|nr:mechanosensitive ion channel family protein [Thiobacillus sp.]
MHTLTLVRHLLVLLLLPLCVGWGVAQAAADTATGSGPPVTLRWMQRDIVTLRATLGGASPESRVERARERLLAMPPSAMNLPLQTLPFTLEQQSGVQFEFGDRLLFSLVADDLDPEARDRSLALQVAAVSTRLEEARIAWHQTRDPALWWVGLAKAALGSAVAALLFWGLSRGHRWLVVWLEARRQQLAQRLTRVHWRELLDRFASRVVQLVYWLLLALLVFLWVEWVLGAFVLTQPIALRWQHWLVERMGWVLEGMAAGIPGLLTLVIVLVITRAAVDLLRYFFDAVQAGRVQWPFLHPETTVATRRIVVTLVWVLGVGVAYPYLPGAGTEAFRGLSVLVGLMITLGASGIVTQAMSGLLLIYARALRKGDYVQVGTVEGVVTEVAPLATKVLNLRNEEITIPNAVLIASPIHNFSRLSESKGTLVSTQVTIGYDAPWRQVHQLLTEAALATPHFRTEPAPRVFQRALSDFYVEYEVIVSMDRPIERITALSALHANIQDAFNRAGVQIMSPHYLSDPAQPVIVPPERWSPAGSSPAEAG